MPATLQISQPLDMHLHLRDGDMLELVAPYTAEQFAGLSRPSRLLRPARGLASQNVSARSLREIATNL